MPWNNTPDKRRQDQATYGDPEYVKNRRIVMRRANGRCECSGDCGGHEGLCGRRDRRLQCDHIIPASVTVDHSLGNLRAICAGPGSCHARKSAREGGRKGPAADPEPTPRTQWLYVPADQRDCQSLPIESGLVSVLADLEFRCTACREVKAATEFSVDRSKASGRKSRCKKCDSVRYRDYYRHRGGGAASKARYRANRDTRLAQTRAWRTRTGYNWAEVNPAAARAVEDRKNRRRREKNAAPNTRSRALMLVAQGNRCALCLAEFATGDKIVLDHDHRHCAYGRSCIICRRGLAHEQCNQLTGLAAENITRLRVIAANLVIADGASKARIATAIREGWPAGRSARLWRERLRERQHGLCFLCAEPLADGPQNAHVDHDHTCPRCGPSTSKGTRTCQVCRRGLAHPACNQIVGLAGEDASRLLIIARQVALLRDEVTDRMQAAGQGGRLAA